jgi:hypothetical protein
VASRLLKWVEYPVDNTEDHQLELRNCRDIDGREVDFVITERRRRIAFFGCCPGDDAPSPGQRDEQDA